MIDGINLKVPNNLNDIEFETFCKTFLLYKTNNKSYSFFHNKGNQNLKQCSGIYIKTEENKNGKFITFDFSLHKFYNYQTKNQYINFDDFTFENVREAIFILQDFLKLDLLNATVIFWEFGLNIQTARPPQDYMTDLISVNVRNRKVFTWDIKYKKYTLYSTENRKGKRKVYVIYDKTAESKDKDKTAPDNTLRVEIKHREDRIKLKLKEFLNKDFQNKCKVEFRNAFINKLEIKKYPLEQFTITEKEVLTNLYNLGIEETLAEYKNQFLEGMKKSTYNRRKKLVNKFTKSYKNLLKETEKTKNLKELIISKLKEL